jgi:gamma-glutamyl-gamma-aminobutyrate hydrolase PuuD
VATEADPARATRLLVGLSPRLLRSVPRELGFQGKTLQYLEQSVAHWVMAHGAMTVMVPSMLRGSGVLDLPVSAADYAQRLDALVLQGGADIDPSCYGQAPHAVQGPCDIERDLFELDLLRAFIAADKPVLGICRGMQLINVVLGGTLHQDLLAAGAATDPHHDAAREEQHGHALSLAPGGWLAQLYGAQEALQVNSIHHQGVDRLGDGLVVEARSPDGVVEAIRHATAGFLVGVQWHPEFHDARFPDRLASDRLMVAFLAAAHARTRAAGGAATMEG